MVTDTSSEALWYRNRIPIFLKSNWTKRIDLAFPNNHNDDCNNDKDCCSDWQLYSQVHFLIQVFLLIAEYILYVTFVTYVVLIELKIELSSGIILPYRSTINIEYRLWTRYLCRLYNSCKEHGSLSILKNYYDYF